MSELDEAWAEALAAAEQRARAAGRSDMAEYLRLRTSNDLLRQTGIEWLMTTFTILAGQANRTGSSLQMSEADAHRFRVGNSSMVGRLLKLSSGVRTLSVEAGWPRVPSDGFIRGGGLASARIRHLGRKSMNEELLLVRSKDGAPRWVVIEDASRPEEFLAANIQRHLTRLVSENYR